MGQVKIYLIWSTEHFHTNFDKYNSSYSYARYTLVTYIVNRNNTGESKNQWRIEEGGGITSVRPTTKRLKTIMRERELWMWQETLLQKFVKYGVNLTFFAPWLPWQRPPFWIFCSTPNSCHTLRWIFLQSCMKFDERNPIFFLNPPL